MKNFRIIFSNPWFLLLLIPAFAFTAWHYFRLNKKYRRTRNRIVSIALHLIIMILSISVFSGVTFAYDEPNLTNEVLLLVDVSLSNSDSQQRKDQYIKSVLDACDENDAIIQVGIVTFGYKPVYAAEFDTDTDKVLEEYRRSERPDDTATDIASALLYAQDLFTHPETGKIILMSDGIETDGTVMSAIVAVTSKGLRIDTVLFSDKHDYPEAQIVTVETPDYNIEKDEPVKLNVIVQSSVTGLATIFLYDNGILGYQENRNLAVGINNIEIMYTFTSHGPHEVYFEVTGKEDTLTENNAFHSYFFLQVFDKILIIERDGEAAVLESLLKKSESNPDGYEVKVINIADAPDTVDGLRAYDEVILMNISNGDMPKYPEAGINQPKGFDEVLHSYVYEYGGGLFTVGGSKTVIDDNGDVKLEDGKPLKMANTYVRADMRPGSKDSLYQKMLPIECIDYTPPFALMIIIDRSDSMTMVDSSTKTSYLELAKAGAIECIKSLSERDYVGVVTLELNYSQLVSVVSATRKDEVITAVSGIRPGGGTVFSGAINLAGVALQTISNVERKHIIMITDGDPMDTSEDFGPLIKAFYENSGITFSVFGIKTYGDASILIKNMATIGGGKARDVWDLARIAEYIKEDVSVPDIRAYHPEPFTPVIKDRTSYVVRGVKDEDIPELGGFYGTKIRPPDKEATVILAGEYVPIYAQWKYGKGKVGSFMSDLNGTEDSWSETFLQSEAGLTIINNILRALSPTEDISPKPLNAKITPQNYSQQVDILTDLKQGESITVTVTAPKTEIDPELATQIIIPGAMFTRCEFIVSQPGVYEIMVEKKDSVGNLIGEPYITHSTFSYSAEYNIFIDPDIGKLLLVNIAKSGSGAAVVPSDADALNLLLGNFIPILHKRFDPRFVFMIIAIILFLLDIAVRKFKFKWPWEIVRDRKATAAQRQSKKLSV